MGRAIRRIFWRTVGVVMCLLVPALLMISTIEGITSPAPEPSFKGSWPLVWAGLIAVLNFNLSFIRPWRYRKANGSMEGYRFVSGIPLIGWAGILAAMALGWGAAGTSLMALALCGIDTGGPVWFLIMIWRDRSFWDGPASTRAQGVTSRRSPQGEARQATPPDAS